MQTSQETIKRTTKRGPQSPAAALVIEIDYVLNPIFRMLSPQLVVVASYYFQTYYLCGQQNRAIDAPFLAALLFCPTKPPQVGKSMDLTMN